MSNITRRILEIFVWLMIAGVLMMMFGFSAQNAEESSGISMKITKKLAQVTDGDFEKLPQREQKTVIGYLHPIVRKAAHFSEYALLGALFLCATLFRRWKYSVKIFAALNASLLCAMADELHQTFVAGRSGELRDVFIDFSGAAVGVLCLSILRCVILYFYQKRKNKAGTDSLSTEEKNMV